MKPQIGTREIFRHPVDEPRLGYGENDRDIQRADEDPINNGALWDRVKIGGLVMPGRAEISGSIKQKMKLNDAAGQNGSTGTFMGWQATEFDIQLTMWRPEHLHTFRQLILGRIRPPEHKGKPEVHDISHPLLDLFGIRRVYITECSFPKRNGQTLEASIHCIDADQIVVPIVKVAKKTKLDHPTTFQMQSGGAAPPSETNGAPSVNQSVEPKLYSGGS